MSQPGRSPLYVLLLRCFLLHIAMEIPLAIQGIWLNNTAIVVLKMYSSLVLSVCIVRATLLSSTDVPEFLPGKRALAIAFACTIDLIDRTLPSPTLIPFTLGSFFEALLPKSFWGCAHGFLGLGFVGWWQGTVAYNTMMK
ncbi:hypothetical protein EDB84DRAFT_1478146, partial [Lactarius hengduanensis]